MERGSESKNSITGNDFKLLSVYDDKLELELSERKQMGFACTVNAACIMNYKHCCCADEFYSL